MMGENRSTSKQLNIFSREEEYRRINEELEARTAALVREADTLLKGSDEYEEDAGSYLAGAYSEEIENELDNFKDDDNVPKHTKFSSAKADDKKTVSKGTKIPKKRAISGIAGKPGNAAENVATLDEKAFLSDLHNRVHAVAEQVGQSVDDDNDGVTDETALAAAGDDVLPGPAAELGLEAQNRFLKAKLRVMQEECEKLAKDYNAKCDESVHVGSRVKEVEEERNRLHRTNTAQQTQMDKYKKISEESKTKADRLESELSAVKKELDSMKRSLDTQGSSQKTQNVRLNRALEEVDRVKAELTKCKATSRDAVEADRRRVDQLLAENKKLEKQKAELVAGFKKQMRLIDVLKRQRMHIEAAKMLQFAEEDFVKALDWSN